MAMTRARPADLLTKGYRDLHQHIEALEQAGLLVRVRRLINKDTELHPLVRWQFRGGLAEEERRAFLFENVTDVRGGRYSIPVLVGGLAASPQIYAVGLQCSVAEMERRWEQALAEPIDPMIVEEGPVQEVVHSGQTLMEHGGLDEFPVPISTPGFDNAPYTTACHWVTKDPETGTRNLGNYRGQLKGPLKIGYNVGRSQHGRVHWRKCRDRGIPLPAAIVIGCPPVVSYAAVTKVPYGVDEYSIAGGLAREPIRLVKCKTVDIEVPADAELVIEGLIRTDVVEPEGPFGESHGYVHPRQISPFMEVTAITHRRDMVYTSFISQVTPSESSVIKKTGYTTVFLRHLRDSLSIKSVLAIEMYEPLLNIRPFIIIQMRQPTRSDVWRALHATATYHQGEGKLVVAVDEDIDPKNLEAVVWAICYRSKPHLDTAIVRGMDRGHSPPFVREEDPEQPEEGYYERNDNSALLIDAVLKEPFPPISLPKQEYMENARRIWEELGLPKLNPREPWYGYSLGMWEEEWEEEARLALEGRHYETGAKLAQRQTPTRNVHRRER